MVHLIQDPKGETVMDPSGTADAAMLSIQSKPTSVAAPSSQDNVSQLKQRILELERKLQAKGIVMICQKFLYHSGILFLYFR